MDHVVVGVVVLTTSHNRVRGLRTGSSHYGVDYAMLSARREIEFRVGDDNGHA